MGSASRRTINPAYVDHYQFLCPNREEVYLYLADLFGRVAEVPEVDGIHLDFIRFPDVILARGLWKKYGLVMDREYPQFDYCYCDKCVADFKAKTGLDIGTVKDPSKVEGGNNSRYDLITNLVNRLAKDVRSKGKRITAAVFPGPNSVAKKIVRQEWDKWDLDAFFPMNYNDLSRGDEVDRSDVQRGCNGAQQETPSTAACSSAQTPRTRPPSRTPKTTALCPKNWKPRYGSPWKTARPGYACSRPTG